MAASAARFQYVRISRESARLSLLRVVHTSFHETTSMLRRSFRMALIAIVMATPSIASTAHAQLDLGVPGKSSIPGSNIGNDERTVFFQALTDFTMTSTSIQLDPLAGGATKIAAIVRAATFAGGVPSRGALLQTAAADITDVGLDFYEIPLSFSFVAGNYYDLAFYQLNGSTGWGNGINNLGMFAFDYRNSPAYSVGAAVKVIDGGCFDNGCNGYDNFGIPYVRMNTATVTPEPGTIVMLALGLAALTFARRRLYA